MNESSYTIPELPEAIGGRYVLGKGVGSGSSGVVYLARDRKTGAQVAVKIREAQDKEQPLPKDAFPSFTAEWRSKGGQPIASAPALTEAEQKEFEDWRAWQEWKRKNPK